MVDFLVSRKKNIDREVPEYKHIPYMRHVSPEVIKTTNGDYLFIMKLKGISAETSSDETLDINAQNRNSLMTSFDGKPLMFYSYTLRKKISVSHTSSFEPGFLKDLDIKYNGKFKNKRYYVNELYLVVLRKNTNKFLKALSTNAQVKNQDDEVLHELNDYITTLKGNLGEYQVDVLTTKERNKLAFSEPMTFLGYLINHQNFPFTLPKGPLNKYLSFNRKFFGYKHIGVKKKNETLLGALISIKNYSTETHAGMLDVLSALPCEFVLTQSWKPNSRQEAKEKAQKVVRQMTQADEANGLSHEIIMKNGAIDQLSSMEISMGENHFSLYLYSDNERHLEDCIGLAQADLTQLGIIPVVDNINNELAFWAQLPGNYKYIARTGDISSFNFADFSSFHNMPIGEGTCKWGEKITTMTTTLGTPYNFNIHNGDLGFVNIVGPAGSGKSVVFYMMVAQAMKHNPNVFLFDKDQGAKIFVKASGGEYFSIEIGEKTGWAPLKVEDTKSNRAFVKKILTEILTDGKKDFSPNEKNELNSIVNVVFDLEFEERILRNLEGYVTSSLPKRRTNFLRWITDNVGRVGENAWIFDNEGGSKPERKQGKITGFDITQFIDNEDIRGSIMLYLFHSILESLDGSPTIFGIEEAWKALADDVFADFTEDGARTFRKKNCCIITATQKPADGGSNSTLIEQSPTQLFFTNKKAKREAYEAWDLSERELYLIKEKIPPKKGWFLLKTPESSLVVRVDLTGMDDEIAILSGRTSTVKLMDSLIEEHGDDPDKWLPHFKQQWRLCDE